MLKMLSSAHWGLCIALVALAPECWFGGQADASQSGCYPITAADLADTNRPRFEQFATPRSRMVPAPVDLKSDPRARRYRTVLTEGARTGPNFAGHYTVVLWGCGSSCTTLAIVDAQTGRVHFPGEFTSISGVHLSADEFEPDAKGNGSWGVRYRPDSRLLIVLGALNEDDHREGATYYVFEREMLRRIHTTYVRKRSCEPAPPTADSQPQSELSQRGGVVLALQFGTGSERDQSAVSGASGRRRGSAKSQISE
jgi:hypothetical protein